MKKFILIALLGLMISCSNMQNSNYDGNLEIAKEWFEVFVTEDFDALTQFYADEIEFQSAFYGGPIMNKEETLNYLKGWQDAMEDITWEAENYLPGVDPETGLPNGSVRTYGYWSGTNTASGKSFRALWYHYLTFDENGRYSNNFKDLTKKYPNLDANVIGIIRDDKGGKETIMPFCYQVEKETTVFPQLEPGS